MNDQPDSGFPSQLAFRYRYERLLGEGSNGKTYLATSLTTGDRVAIKALKLKQSESFKSFELFKREAETLSSIQVPGVPKFYESLLSNTPDGESFIIQEYIDAPSLQSYLDKGKIFTEDETMRIMAKIMTILHYLHTQYSPPIIHRDIKPSNILFRLPDDVANWDAQPLYLIDFGAVANAHSNSDKSTIAGTVGYMAPEQNFGECLPQTDLYAVGATALHMLTGVAPFDMDFDTYTLKYEEALKAHAPGTSKAFRRLLGDLLNYASDKRPASAKDVLATLHSLQRGDTPQAYKPEKKPWLLTRILRHIGGMINKVTMNVAPKEDDYGAQINPQSTLFNPKRIQCVLGSIQCYTLASNTVEYTFMCENRYWHGMSSLPIACAPFVPDEANLKEQCMRAGFNHDDTIHLPRKIQFPASCIVIHHIKDPSINILLYINSPPHAPKAPAASAPPARLE